MKLVYGRELKTWSVYFLAILLSAYIHEVGHCIPAWMNGVRAIPTPAKEYILSDVSQNLQQYISLGGVLGTILFTLGVLGFFVAGVTRAYPSLIAAAIAVPGFYTLRFLLLGRGHSGAEFQEGQAALGLSYAGHSMDWIMMAMFVAGVFIWTIIEKPRLRIVGRLLTGVILTLIFVVSLQVLNNMIFDPIFGPE